MSLCYQLQWIMSHTHTHDWLHGIMWENLMQLTVLFKFYFCVYCHYDFLYYWKEGFVILCQRYLFHPGFTPNLFHRLFLWYALSHISSSSRHHILSLSLCISLLWGRKQKNIYNVLLMFHVNIYPYLWCFLVHTFVVKWSESFL